MRKNKFKGYLGRLMQEHLDLRRGLGRDYSTNEWTLLGLNQMIHRRWPKARTITKNMVMIYLRSSRHRKMTTRKNEITYIRMFTMDLCSRGIKAFVPERSLLPKAQTNVRIHIFSEAEIKKAIAIAALKNGSAGHVYPVLVGLLWVTGLRVMEALSLNVGDIDWGQRTLFVRKGKFGKSRIIPLSQSTIKALRSYVEKLDELGFNIEPDAPFFVTTFKQKKRLSVRAAGGALHSLYRRAKIKTSWGGYPRTHDLRHSFATRSLRAIRDIGDDPSNSIPALAVVMGHSHVAHTQLYLHPSMETLQIASKSFEKKLFKLRRAA